MAKKRKPPAPSKRASKVKARAPKRKPAAGEPADADASLSVLDGPMKSIIRAAFLK
ncbi:MAG: hypothetical protein ACE5GT_03825 [Rhodospirillales bacterium]